MKSVLMVALLVTFVTASAAFGQEPVAPIDIKADDITYTFPSPGQIEITVHYTIQSAHKDPATYVSALRVLLGTREVNLSTMVLNAPASVCDVDPDCNAPCLVQSSTGELVWDNCNWWHTWHGAYCDPGDPGGTCEPLDYCACGSQYVLVVNATYEGEETATFELDPNSAVYEADETNNTCTTQVMAPPPEPVAPIDIKADDITYTFPSPGQIEITAFFTIQGSHKVATNYTSDLRIRLGSNIIYSSGMSIDAPASVCDIDPDCNSLCLIEVSPGVVTWDHCNWWNTWYGPSCDPSDPTHTCMPMTICACGSQYMLVATADYNAETELYLEADSAELVYESDETNNTCMKTIGEISTEPSSWGAIKSLF